LEQVKHLKRLLFNLLPLLHSKVSLYKFGGRIGTKVLVCTILRGSTPQDIIMAVKLSNKNVLTIILSSTVRSTREVALNKRLFITITSSVMAFINTGTRS
jgi:hypothetical protein